MIIINQFSYFNGVIIFKLSIKNLFNALKPATANNISNNRIKCI